MSHQPELSPAELAADLLNRWGSPPVPVVVVVGPANDAKQQSGVISIMAAGLPNIEKYDDTQWLRAQFRCLHGTLAQADTIAQAVQRDVHGVGRKRLYMASTDTWYLMHLSNIVAGPSMHFDSAETWEALLFAEMKISTVPINNVS
jgi:hypothetical protein